MRSVIAAESSDVAAGLRFSMCAQGALYAQVPLTHSWAAPIFRNVRAVSRGARERWARVRRRVGHGFARVGRAVHRELRRPLAAATRARRAGSQAASSSRGAGAVDQLLRSQSLSV